MAQYTDGWSYQENLLMKYHIKMGHDVTMLTSKKCYSGGKLTEDDKAEFYDSNGARIIRLEYKNKGFGKLPTYKGFYSLLCDIKPDIIFSHGCQYVDFANVGKYVKKNPECVLYCDNHADFSNSATNFFSKNILHRVIWSHYAKKNDPYVRKWYGVLPARVDFLKNIYGLPKEKLELLVMGADDEKVNAAKESSHTSEIRKKYGIADDDFLIMTGGKIDMAKQQTLLLMEAVNRLNDPKIKLIVFGSVSPQLTEKVNSNCSEKVQYVGWVNSDDSYKYFSAADLVVFPGRHSVFWEQVAGLGKPMVCKYWDGTTHVDVGGNVRFLYKDSADEIYDVIKELTDSNEVFENMKYTAESKGQKEFSYKAIARRSIEAGSDEAPNT